jgi:hypothetical protein
MLLNRALTLFIYIWPNLNALFIKLIIKTN